MAINKVFWAKKNEENGVFKWLTLEQHLLDTKAVAGLLWEHWLSDGQKLLVQKLFPTDSERAKDLVQLIALLHDWGKMTPAFQLKKSFSCSTDLDLFLIEKLEINGFSDNSLLQLQSPEMTPHGLASQYLMSINRFNEDIASIVGAHHGKPVDTWKKVTEQKSYSSNYYRVEDINHPLHKKWKCEQDELLRWALQETDFSSVKEIPEIPQVVQVILSGLLIMADWIASNENYFPLIPVEQDTILDQDKRIDFGWKKWKKGDLWKSNYSVDFKEIYNDRFGFNPRESQSILSETIEKTVDPGIVIFEAPMGLGKTEAALIAVEQVAKKTGRSGLFFGLPTQATSNGIFPRINSWLQKLPLGSDEKVQIRLSHGKAALNEDFSSLAKNINVDEEKNASVIVNEWFSGRKTTALDDFVVGTVDNFLLLALKQKHLALRHLGFSKKVVVIDEVHAYDAYMNQYLLEAMEWMGAYGVPVIILSATLPFETREKLIKEYMKGKGLKASKVAQKMETFAKDAYPLITYTDAEEVMQVRAFEPISSKTIKVIREPMESLYTILDQCMESEGVIGVIVNTVRRAQEITKECVNRYGEELVELLHSNFIATDRINKEKHLLEMIGKDASRPKKKIIIGTQVMEQSLDIDFDFLISDLAPMDLLIQRIGRLHRHDIIRPKRFKDPTIVVLGTDDNLEFDEGMRAVYGDYLLARTQCFLPSEINIPQDISPLVQQVYGKTNIFLDANLKEKIEKMKEGQETVMNEKKNKANAFRLNAPMLEDNGFDSNSLIGWLSNLNPNANESEERAYAQVRDIEDTVEVIALKKVGNGYGTFSGGEDISHIIMANDVAREIAKETLRLPRILCIPRRIDKTIEDLETFNKQYLSSWGNQTWIKGTLGIIFNQENSFIIDDIVLHYDLKYGLLFERMEM